MRVAVAILLCCAISGCRAATDHSAPAGAPSAARNLVIITIDTLRADRVGAYGYKAGRTAAIDGSRATA